MLQISEMSALTFVHTMLSSVINATIYPLKNETIHLRPALKRFCLQYEPVGC